MISPTTSLAGRRTRIALLEDDHGVRRSMQLLLQGRGFDVKAYGNPEALLADPEMANAACLLADYRLGELDGIAVITAFGSAELAARAEAAGFCEVFDKPLKDHSLITALERVTQQQ
jgi:FixJ family two-component response regulator